MGTATRYKDKTGFHLMMTYLMIESYHINTQDDKGVQLALITLSGLLEKTHTEKNKYSMPYPPEYVFGLSTVCPRSYAMLKAHRL